MEYPQLRQLLKESTGPNGGGPPKQPIVLLVGFALCFRLLQEYLERR